MDSYLTILCQALSILWQKPTHLMPQQLMEAVTNTSPFTDKRTEAPAVKQLPKIT